MRDKKKVIKIAKASTIICKLYNVYFGQSQQTMVPQPMVPTDSPSEKTFTSERML